MKKIIFIFSCLSVIATACNKSGWETTTNGLEYKIIDDQDTGKTIKLDDVISFRVTFRNANDSIYESNVSEPEPGAFLVPAPTHKGCINEGWTLLSEGDSVVFKVVADSFYFKTFKYPQMPPFVKSGEIITISFRILTVQTKEEAQADYMKKQAEMDAELNKKFEADSKEAADYAGSKLTNAIAHPSGFYYVVKKEGTGELIQTGDKVKLSYTSTFLDGKVAEDYEGDKAVEVTLGRDPMMPAWIDAIPMMKEGAEWIMVIPSKLAYGERGFGSIPPFTALVFNIKIVNVKDKAEIMAEMKKTEEKEPQLIKDFLSKKGNDGFKQTETGLYYLSEKTTTGAQPKVGDQITVHYTGKFLDGKIFDSSVDRGQPFKFVVGQGQVISGWDEALMRMHVGEKYRLVLPSKIAYGPTGNQGIPPYTPLYFDVELIAIGDIK